MGDGLKGSSSINEINRTAQAIFDFAKSSHSNQGITSERAQVIYDWVLTLSEQSIDTKTKISLLDQFIENLTPPTSPLRKLTRPDEQRNTTDGPHQVLRNSGQTETWDAFIVHASEDKEKVARPLYHRLKQLGLDLWYDEFSLKVGDSLREKIDFGLSKSRFGIVILSPNFFKKNWTRIELDGLYSKSSSKGSKVILPIWHEVNKNTVEHYSPTLAGLKALTTSDGIDTIAFKLFEEIRNIPAYDGPQYSTKIDETIKLEKLRQLQAHHQRLGEHVFSHWTKKEIQISNDPEKKFQVTLVFDSQGDPIERDLRYALSHLSSYPANELKKRLENEVSSYDKAANEFFIWRDSIPAVIENVHNFQPSGAQQFVQPPVEQFNWLTMLSYFQSVQSVPQQTELTQIQLVDGRPGNYPAPASKALVYYSRPDSVARQIALSNDDHKLLSLHSEVFKLGQEYSRKLEEIADLQKNLRVSMDKFRKEVFRILSDIEEEQFLGVCEFEHRLEK